MVLKELVLDSLEKIHAFSIDGKQMDEKTYIENADKEIEHWFVDAKADNYRIEVKLK